MLATVSNDIPLREHSHLDLSNTQPIVLDDRLCPGCKTSVVSHHGGLVVAFGQSFFHVDCFKCAKCRNQVTADTNLLLLSDGSPICANCSYSCNICQLPILDEAIMAGDDSYHAHCFKCKICSSRIDELVFAKTSQGIYCMPCHNERMIKIRKHAQKKAERERANGGSGSSRSREHEAKNFHRDLEKTSVDDNSHSIRSQKTVTPPRVPSRLHESQPPKSPRQTDMTYRSHPEARPPSYSHSVVSTTHPASLSPPSDSSLTTPSPLLEVSPSDPNTFQLTNATSASALNPSESHTYPIPVSLSSDLARRNSYDDGRSSVKQDSQNHGLHTKKNPVEGLAIPPRNNMRRSIDPGLSISSAKKISDQSLNLSLRQSNSLDQDGTSVTLYSSNIDDQSQSIEYSKTSSPSLSRSSSMASTPSSNAHFNSSKQSNSSSPIQDSYYGSRDNTVVMRSPTSIVVELDDPPHAVTSKVVAKSSLRVSDPTSVSPKLHTTGFQNDSKRNSSVYFGLENLSQHSSRSPSPDYRVDVPRSVESINDTEPEREFDNSFSDSNGPPAPPPKDAKNSVQASQNAHELDSSLELFQQSTDLSEDVESPAEEQLSHTTYIAPALPPIRFSMNTADFSELLSSVGGLPLKSLDNFAKLSKKSTEAQIRVPPFGTETVGTTGNNSFSERRDPSVEILKATEDIYLQNVDELDSTSRMADSEEDFVIIRLREILNDAKEKRAMQLKVELGFVEAIIEYISSQKADFEELRNKVDGMNRQSKLYIDGLTVAQTEYDQELKARRDAEAEVTRLRVLLSGQAVRLTALSGDNRRQELRQQLSKELNDNLSGLEHDLSRLKVERDVALAEVEELSAKKYVGSTSDVIPSNLGRSLTKRLENIRNQYHRDLVPLTEQKEALTREIAELKSVRDVFLEETTVLNARNEELAQLSAVYARRIESSAEMLPKGTRDMLQASSDVTRSQQPSHLFAPSLSSSTSGSSTMYDENAESRLIKAQRSENELHTPVRPKFKWPGSKTKDLPSPSSVMEISKGKTDVEHNFQQLSVLRFTRCDHCGVKMWGSQLRCTVCSTSIHVRCIANVQIPCTQHQSARDELQMQLPLQPSMFGRDLTEQVRADSKLEDRRVPVIVEKCIEAVEKRALDYEGIYRKTGGSGQTKAITQLFERGDYASFDLCDSDQFPDICSVTSVLKTYFRSLPNPLLTFDLHDQFTSAIRIRDPTIKLQSFVDLINKLPNEHYFTLRLLMLHLNRIHEHSESSLMNARNLGVVFGPTLMRSRDPAAEFSDMAGKALFIEWLVDRATQLFNVRD